MFKANMHSAPVHVGNVTVQPSTMPIKICSGTEIQSTAICRPQFHAPQRMENALASRVTPQFCFELESSPTSNMRREQINVLVDYNASKQKGKSRTGPEWTVWSRLPQ